MRDKVNVKKIILFVCSLLLPVFLLAAPVKIDVKGRVIDASNSQPLSGAVLVLDDNAAWAVADLDGYYIFQSVNPGTYLLKVENLGYVTSTFTLVVKDGTAFTTDASGKPAGLDFALSVESLALDEVVVTANRPAGTLGTSHSIGKEALEHLQMSNISDMSALLPGGKTVNPDLTKDQAFSLRDGGSTEGNAAFATALEVDGVRLGGNAGLNEPAGASTRTIAVENIESVEVITGIPSVEYGDMNSGMVKINTKKGRTPVNVTFSVNPRTYQVAASKGIDLGTDKEGNSSGVLNVSGEWARATQKIISPYTSYTRRGITATYTNTFNKILRFEAGATANIGGMDSKDDPDANSGNYEKGRDNAFRAHTNLSWMLNKDWITSFKLEGSASFNDNLITTHKFFSSATTQPAIHNEEKGYAWATLLPLSYYSDQVEDSKQLIFSVSAKYDWTRSFGSVKNRLKAGVQFKSDGNVGQGEYYEDPALAPNSYRPRPYSQYPFMNNLSEYLEDQVTLPIGSTKLDVVAGLRLEQLFIKDSQYKGKTSLSPRFNLKWALSKTVTVRGGWGISEKLPSFWVLYPKQEYRDIQTFSFTSGTSAYYAYCTVPFQMEYNPNLKWQRASNAEAGIDLTPGKWKISLVGYYNVTRNPYKYLNSYIPVTYRVSALPNDFEIPVAPQLRVDSQTGEVYMRGENGEYWTPMETKVVDKTFVKNTIQANGSPITRAGVELTVDFPEIKPIRTSFRLDASYGYTSYTDDQLSAYYNIGWSHTSEKSRSYQYAGIYARGASSNTANGKKTNRVDANLTSITHIPEARLVITCRFEAAILRRTQNLSWYNGAEYAFNVTESSLTPTGGSIYGSNSYAAIRPVYYMDLDGNIHPFTDAEAADPQFANLFVKTANAYSYSQDGYGFYCSANLSITKEIGDHVSLSFFANNFTASRPSVASLATGVHAVFTPDFYYGLTCRLKF